jgi:plasmid stabilization system protein ParE
LTTEIRWTIEARADVDAIRDFLADRGEAIVNRTVGRIFERVDQLRYYPRSGRVALAAELPQVRELPAGRYRIYYWVAAEYIEILAIHHGRQRPLADLFEEMERRERMQ